MKIILALFAVLTLTSQAQACDDAFTSYPADCRIQDHYRSLRSSFAALGVNMDDIAQYKALRFIARPDWQKANASGNYDPHTIYQPAPLVWNTWLKGEDFSQTLKADQLTIDDVASINKHAMTNETISPLAKWKGASPGAIRENPFQIRPGFKFSCADKTVDKALLEQIYSGGYDLRTANGKSLMTILIATTCDDFQHYAGVMMYSKTTDVLSSLNEWLSSMKSELAANSRSPIATIAFYQRWFVAIHPFGDGNGRTSRFIEDILSRHYDLPYVPAGDLQNDVLTQPLQYETQTSAAMINMLNALDSCLSEYRVKPSMVSPACQTL